MLRLYSLWLVGFIKNPTRFYYLEIWKLNSCFCRVIKHCCYSYVNYAGSWPSTIYILGNMEVRLFFFQSYKILPLRRVVPKGKGRRFQNIAVIPILLRWFHSIFITYMYELWSRSGEQCTTQNYHVSFESSVNFYIMC